MKPWILALGLGCWMTLTATAQDTPLHKKITVDYRGMGLADVLKDMGGKAGVQFARADKLLAGADNVTCEARDQEAGRVLARILQPRGLRVTSADDRLLALVKATDFEEFKVKREDLFEFAEKPKVTREGDQVTISFAAKGWCDATVAIEEVNGKILRHLACGVLGENAPEPFQWNSRRQTLVWDGKDDEGTYIDDKDGITVRVSLGLKAQYEKPLFWEPKKRVSQAIPLMRATEEGVYVFDGRGTDHVRLFDHEGSYVRTVYPFPAAKLNEVKGLDWHTFPQDGKKLPLKKGSQEATLLTSGTTAVAHDAYKTAAGVGAYSMDVRNHQIALAGLRLNRFATDGSSGGLPIYGPEVYLFREPGMKLDFYGHTWVPPTSIALSPDGKWLYLTGYTSDSAYVGGQHGVMRVEYAGDKAPESFLGNPEPAKPGAEAGQFHCASSVDCDGEGRIYVSDYMNDRIQIFAPDGKFLKAISTPRPALVRLHRKTAEIYCFSWVMPNRKLTPPVYGSVKLKPTLIVFGAFDNPAKVSEIDLPLPAQEGYLAGTSRWPVWYTAEVDSWVSPPVIWLGREAVNNQIRGLAGGDGGKTMGWDGRGIHLMKLNNGKLEKIRDFGAETVKSIYRSRPPSCLAQRLCVDPKNHKLYLNEGDSDTDKSVVELLEIGVGTGKISPCRLPIAAEDVCFDLDGLVYLRTHWEVVRYDPATWREVPWDYGEQRDPAAGGSIKALAALPLPAIKPVNFQQNGIWINPKGHLAVSCANYTAKAKKRFEGAYANITSQGNTGGTPYTPPIYPGRARWNEIHVFDKQWIDNAEWLYGGVGFMGQNYAAPMTCDCCRTRFSMDLFDRAFAPEIGHHSVAVLDTNGNLILRVGQYGNEDDGVPLVPHPSLRQPQPIGGDEVALFYGTYVATDTDRRLFIADTGNARIVSVKLGYHAEEKVALKGVKDEGRGNQ